MKKTTIATLMLLALTSNCNAGSWLDSVMSKDDQSAISNVATDTGLIANHSLPVTDLLTNQLGVSTEQAVSGTGALFGLAQQQLSSADLSELESLIPWSSNLPNVQGVLGNIENMQTVKTAFESMGLDPQMVNKFVPVILDYLKQSGASEGLLGTLGEIWKN